MAEARPGLVKCVLRDALYVVGASLAALLCLRFLHDAWQPDLAGACGVLSGLALRRVMLPAFEGFPPFLERPLLVGLVGIGALFTSLASLGLYQKEYWVLRWREGFTVLVFGVVLGLAEAALIYSHARLRDEIEGHRRREAALERRALQARYKALQAQINPHFLFNTFNSLSELIHLSPEDAEALVLDLAHLLRYTLRSSADERVDLGQELEAIKRYLRIEQARFGDRLHVDWMVEDGLRTVRIPGLILQPLVENAVIYAVSERREGGHIKVSARHEGRDLVLCVEDDGPGLPQAVRERLLSEGESETRAPVGTGGAGGALANIKGRLELAYSGAGSLSFSGPEAGSAFLIRIPL